MKKKALYLLLALEAAACMLLNLAQTQLRGVFTTLVAFPLEQIGYGLRLLSLSGSVGNAAAIVIYALISLLPLAFLMRRKRHWEDLFLVLLSADLFFSLYCMINPGLISQKLIVSMPAAFEKTLLGAMFYGFLVGYLVLRLVRSFFSADRAKLLGYLHILLYGFCLLLVYLVFGSGLDGLLTAFEELREANKGSEHLLGTSYVFLSLRYLVNVLPYVLDIIIVHAVRALLQAEQHSEDSVLAASRLSRLCGISLVVMVLSNAAYTLAQLVFLPKVFQSSVQIELPLFSLLFVLATLVAAQYIQENKQLKDDNDLFI